MNKIITILFLVLFTSSVFAAKLYTGGEKYEQDKVVALTLTPVSYTHLTLPTTPYV